jgi:hypothetical protein
MRDELKILASESRVPDEGDLSDTMWVAKNLDRGRHELAMKHQREAEKESKADEELWIVADDIHYYAFKESFLIWHFCLWRLQAILEGIITGRFLNSQLNKKLPGIKAKLDALRQAGYAVHEVDYNELLEWAKIRNQLSHCPPSHYGDSMLNESDVEEYYRLCMKICSGLNEQMKNR